MKRLVLGIVLTAVFAGKDSLAAEQTWTGHITAAMCTTAMKRECIKNCIKAGEKYVFVEKAQVYKIKNQDFGDLETHAGDLVALTGDLASDGKTITVTKVAMASETKK